MSGPYPHGLPGAADPGQPYGAGYGYGSQAGTPHVGASPIPTAGAPVPSGPGVYERVGNDEVLHRQLLWVPVVQEQKYSLPPVQERVVEVPVPVVQERIVEVPKVEYVEKNIDVPKIEYVERIVEVPEIQIQERIVHVPKQVVQEREIQVPKMEYIEKIVEVPQVRYRQVDQIQEVFVPKIETNVVYKDTEVPVPQYRHVPVEKRVEVPVPIPVVEYEDVPVPVIQYRQVPREVKVQVRVPVSVPVHVQVPRYIDVPVDVPVEVVQTREVQVPIPLIRQVPVDTPVPIQRSREELNVLNPREVQVPYVGAPGYPSVAQGAASLTPGSVSQYLTSQPPRESFARSVPQYTASQQQPGYTVRGPISQSAPAGAFAQPAPEPTSSGASGLYNRVQAMFGQSAAAPPTPQGR